MMQKNTIPRQANFTRLNPNIEPLGKDGVMIPTQSMKWKAVKRIALINNYGAGGNNAAMVLQEPIPMTPASSPKTRTQPSHCPIIISGKTTEAVVAYCERLGYFLSRTDMTNTLADVAYNLALKQSREFENSQIITCASIDDLSSQLEKTVSSTIKLHKSPSNRPSVVLCFGGQDGKWAHISKGLYENSVLLQRHIVGDDQLPFSSSWFLLWDLPLADTHSFTGRL